MKQIAKLTLKSGETLKGYWNGKNYNGTLYFNVSDSGQHKDIDWKNSIKIARVDVKSLKWVYDDSQRSNLPKTTEGWMRLMAQAER